MRIHQHAVDVNPTGGDADFFGLPISFAGEGAEFERRLFVGVDGDVGEDLGGEGFAEDEAAGVVGAEVDSAH